MRKLYFIKLTLKSIIYLTLFTLYIRFYFMDQMIEFLDGKTTFAKSYKETHHFKIPNLIICPNPPYIPSKVQKYGYETLESIIYDKHENYLNYDLNAWQMYQEMSYLNNRDIDFYIASNLSNLLQNQLLNGRTNLE